MYRWEVQALISGYPLLIGFLKESVDFFFFFRINISYGTITQTTAMIVSRRRQKNSQVQESLGIMLVAFYTIITKTFFI